MRAFHLRSFLPVSQRNKAVDRTTRKAGNLSPGSLGSFMDVKLRRQDVWHDDVVMSPRLAAPLIALHVRNRGCALNLRPKCATHTDDIHVQKAPQSWRHKMCTVLLHPS